MINKVKDFVGLCDSFAVLKVVGVSNPPPKYYPDLETYLHSREAGYIKGAKFWWQGGSTSDGKETIELKFSDADVTVDEIIEHFKKKGLYTEVLSIKNKRCK